LHPFIPFFTEKVWLDFNFNKFFKTSLMFKKWDLKPQFNFRKSYDKIDWLIQLVTSIRSTKVNLEVSPGSFLDISINELKTPKKNIINDNVNLFRRIGRISNIHESKINRNGIKIIVGGETIILYFDQSLDLHSQKRKIYKNVKNLERKVASLSDKLENKSFLKNAPKQIIKKERKALVGYGIELKKLNSIINSIKD
jgi:valyl-tRNA synthetase